MTGVIGDAGIESGSRAATVSGDWGIRGWGSLLERPGDVGTGVVAGSFWSSPISFGLPVMNTGGGGKPSQQHPATQLPPGNSSQPGGRLSLGGTCIPEPIQFSSDCNYYGGTSRYPCCTDWNTCDPGEARTAVDHRWVCVHFKCGTRQFEQDNECAGLVIV